MKIFKYPKIKDKRSAIKFWKEKRSYQNNMAFAFINQFQGSNVSIVFDGDNFYYQSKNEIIDLKKDRSGFVSFAEERKSDFEYVLKGLYHNNLDKFNNLEAVALRGKFTDEQKFVIYDFAFYYNETESKYRIYTEYNSLFDDKVIINIPYSFKSYRKEYSSKIKSPKKDEVMLVKALREYASDFYEYYDAPLWFKC